MKVRTGFVSNSSSSSYVIIGHDKASQMTTLPADFTIGENGETEFGWGPCDIDDMDSRINFAWYQAHADLDTYLPMLQHVLGEHGVRELRCLLTTEWSEAGKKHIYIDHQSSWSEGENMEIFDDAETLERFIFCKDSEIILDNDNR
jgi:hypothetical protein